jgi:hypothetical protein
MHNYEKRSPKARGATRLTSQVSRNLKRSSLVCESTTATALNRLVAGVSGSKRGPRIAFVYQDEQAHAWAREISQTITKLAGEQGVQASWWKIGDLTAPGILAGAVSSALRADVIVVASQGEGLPLPFYVWVNLWWPNRSEMAGALIAIVGMPERNASRYDKIGEYLRVVAEQARMKFLSIEKPVNASMKKELSCQKHTNGASVWNGHLHD